MRIFNSGDFWGMVGGLAFVAILIGYFFRKYDLDRLIGLDVHTSVRVSQRTVSIPTNTLGVEQVIKHVVLVLNVLVIANFGLGHDDQTSPSPAT